MREEIPKVLYVIQGWMSDQTRRILENALKEEDIRSILTQIHILKSALKEVSLHI